MSSLLFTRQDAPAPPAANQGVLFVDTFVNAVATVDSNGYARSFYNTQVTNIAQTPAAGVRTGVLGCVISIPGHNLQIGSCFKWQWSMTKTAAGSAASTIDIALGTTAGTSDPVILSFTKPAGTAAVDEGTVRLFVVCRGPLTSSCIFTGQLTMTHNGNTVGHLTQPILDLNAVSSPVDVTVASLIIRPFITTGASDAITIQCYTAQAWNI